MTDAARSAALKALRANLPNLDDRGRSFAESIIEYLERGTLSEAQWAWVPYLSGTGPKPAPKGARKPRAKRQPAGSDELRQAREALKGQSREINSLTAEVERLKREVRAAKEAARKANRKAEEAARKAPKGDPNWEAMVGAMRRATSAQRKLVMRSMHPDRWGGAPWATRLFQAANK
tara:strand:- start:473 stop:1003 length:531 start_codon:yes stop_codon:yes gene_type:complete